jgi:hypothetical protein
MPKPTALWCRILSFEAPVRPAAVVEVNREATADEITLKLEQVTDLRVLQEKRRADERTRTAGLILLRVIIQVLLVFARGCKSRIYKVLSLLCLAPSCTVLRSRWCQSGVKIALPSAFTDGELKHRKYGLSRLCHLRKRINIEEQTRVPQNPQIRRSVRTSS